MIGLHDTDGKFVLVNRAHIVMIEVSTLGVYINVFLATGIMLTVRETLAEVQALL